MNADDKRKILNVLLNSLLATLAAIQAAAVDAKAAATDAESKAENKWDTRGLEASYLAGAQAKRANELEATIRQLQSISFPESEAFASVGVRSLVTVLIDDEVEKKFFLLPYGGGTSVPYGDSVIYVLTSESPVGAKLMHKEVGESFTLRTKAGSQEYQILAIQ